MSRVVFIVTCDKCKKEVDAQKCTKINDKFWRCHDCQPPSKIYLKKY